MACSITACGSKGVGELWLSPSFHGRIELSIPFGYYPPHQKSRTFTDPTRGVPPLKVRGTALAYVYYPRRTKSTLLRSELASRGRACALDVVLELAQFSELLSACLAQRSGLPPMHRPRLSAPCPACGCSRPCRGPSVALAHRLTPHRSLAALLARSLRSGLAATGRGGRAEEVHVVVQAMCQKNTMFSCAHRVIPPFLAGCVRRCESTHFLLRYRDHPGFC
jgi:hypothetical protein